MSDPGKGLALQSCANNWRPARDVLVDAMPIDDGRATFAVNAICIRN